jgi:acyl-coenzyme A synthetase/AMP-(fatty) acid ligase
MMENSFCLHSNNIAIIDSRGDLSYSQLAQTVNNIAQKLLDAGIGKYDRIGIESNGRDLIILTLAVIHSGACAVAIPDDLVENEKRTLMEKCFITAVISGKNAYSSEPLLADLTTDKLARGYSILRRHSKLPPALLKSPLLRKAAIIRFTSGTTGSSKGVLLTQRSIAERVNAANKGLGIKENDVILWVLSMAYHFIVSILLYLSAGARIVLPDNNAPETLKKAIKKHRVSVLYASEHLFRTLLTNCAKNDLRSIRKAISTASELTAKTADDFYDKFGIPIMQAYGIIEVGLPFVNNADPVNKPKSVGRISDNYKIKILDIHQNPVKTLETGELFIKGPGFFDAYISPFKTRKDICDKGWFDTGDTGMLDDEGFLYLYGRSKNVINCMGMKIFPSEIEDVLNRHPLIRESLVKAKPHSYLNEVPHAFIVLHRENGKLEYDALIAFCSQYLAAYKIPRSFEYVRALPRTTSGKIIRS